MANLLKADLRRILKDKLFLIVSIIGVLFAVGNPLLLKLIYSSIDDEIFQSLASSKQLFFSAFSVANNFGLLLPIFVIVILFKDFSHGTIRNKIICGKSRFKVFLSLALSAGIIIVGSMLVYAGITFGVASMVMEYSQEVTFTKDIVYFLESVLFEIISYLFVISLVCFLCVFMKSSGVSIILYIALVLIITATPTILMIAAALTDNDIYQFFVDINILYNIGNVIGLGTSYDSKAILSIIIPPIVSSGLLFTLSALRFRKKDIK